MVNEVIFLKRHSKFGLTVGMFQSSIIIVEKDLEPIIEFCCNINSTSLENNRKLCKKLFQFEKKAPILVSQRDGLVLLMTHALTHEECVVFNPIHVKELIVIDKKKTKLLFYGDYSVVVNASLEVIKKQIKRSAEVRDFFSNRKYTPNDLIEKIA